MAQIAGEIEAYGDLLSPLSLVPIVGRWFERFRTSAGDVRKFAERRRESVTARRATLSEKLAELGQPSVVVVDDIDRLTMAEIRDRFKLVRLTASFPQVIYVLVFDRLRVEQALSETGISGRSYLEKIVQVGIDVPIPPRGDHRPGDGGAHRGHRRRGAAALHCRSVAGRSGRGNRAPHLQHA